MQVAEHVAHLERAGHLLTAAAAHAGWDTPVPSCPEWTVRDLVTHVGGVHRWAADIVATGSPTTDTAAGLAVGTGPADDELIDWFRAGHADLVATLRAAPADLECVAFLPAPSPLAFWARRQAHETTVHRADAEAATGAVTPIAPELAQDGLGELLHGFGHRRNQAITTPGTLALRISDGPGWLLRFGGERLVAEQVADGRDVAADAAVAGTASDAYFWLWNRPSGAVVTGDADVAALWRGVRVRWG